MNLCMKSLCLHSGEQNFPKLHILQNKTEFFYFFLSFNSSSSSSSSGRVTKQLSHFLKNSIDNPFTHVLSFLI